MEEFINLLNSNEGLIAVALGIPALILTIIQVTASSRHKKDAEPMNLGGNYFTGNSIYGNGRDGVHISTGNTVEKESLSTHQRQAVEKLRKEWLIENNSPDQSVGVYNTPWRQGELEWVNQKLKIQGKWYRVE